MSKVFHHLPCLWVCEPHAWSLGPLPQAPTSVPPGLLDSPRHGGEGLCVLILYKEGRALGQSWLGSPRPGAWNLKPCASSSPSSFPLEKRLLTLFSLSSAWHRLGLPNANAAGARASPWTDELVTAWRMNACSAACPRECGSGAARHWHFSGEVRNPNFRMELSVCKLVTLRCFS